MDQIWGALAEAVRKEPLEALGMAADFLTAFMAVAAILVSVGAFRRQIASEHYGEIDKIYFDLLHIRVMRPDLGRCDRRPDGSFPEGYDAFAFMMVNFLETILDRCDGDRELERTWQPIIEIETINHLAWLNEPENQAKFKRAFLEFLAAGGFHKHRRSRQLSDRIRNELKLVDEDPA